jgi:hydrogenase expression/formation protein HypC
MMVDIANHRVLPWSGPPRAGTYASAEYDLGARRGQRRSCLMCLGIPGKVIAISETDGIRMGKVDFDGIVKEVCLAYLPEIAVGDYTIVHVGFAISQLDEQSARETLALFHELGILEEELGAGDATEVAP